MVVEFYRRVESQYTNQTPMGAAKGSPPVLTPRIGDWIAILDRFYDRSLHSALLDAAQTLHWIVTKQDAVEWWTEFGKPVHEVTLEDIGR